jgi:polyisoprenoid-binding protein YceI
MKDKIFEIVPVRSNIDWIGRKVTGAHNGTIAIKEGALVLNDGKLVDGNFVVDTTSIKILDVMDPATNAQFAGHLASADFFASEKFPEALFVIISAERNGNNNYRINGNLTIRGITHPVTFDATLNVIGENLTASGKIIVDRTLYGMKFRSGNFFKDLGDVLIYNDFDLNVNINAKAVTKQFLADVPGIN